MSQTRSKLLARARRRLRSAPLSIAVVVRWFAHDGVVIVRVGICRGRIARGKRPFDRLIKSGTWNEVPSFEDQLPEDDMPKAFFDYWFSDSSKA